MGYVYWNQPCSSLCFILPNVYFPTGLSCEKTTEAGYVQY